jgi:hypothetical protein
MGRIVQRSAAAIAIAVVMVVVVLVVVGGAIRSFSTHSR